MCSLSLQNEFSKELRLPSGGKFQALEVEAGPELTTVRVLAYFPKSVTSVELDPGPTTQLNKKVSSASKPCLTGF